MIVKMNKKASVWINVLVLLVVATCLVALFSFVNNSGKLKEDISGAFIIDEVLIKGNSLDFEIENLVENVLVETYEKFVDSQSYMNSPIENPRGSGNWEFGELHKTLNEDFKKEFDKNFKLEFSKLGFEEDFKKIVSEGKFESSLNGNKFNFKISGKEFKSSLKDVEVSYIPEIELVLDLNRIGLISFEEIYNCKEIVKKGEDCALNNFDVSKSGEVVELASKKEFLIGKDFKNIEFGFLIK